MTEHSILVAGETLIDFIPDTAGPLSGVETFHRRAGGAPANVAVGLARLGETPGLCTTLSTDPFGDFLADRLAAEGIPEAFITRVDNPTALAFVSHAADGDREFSFHRERTADTVLQTDVVDTTALAAADWLVVGGVALSAEPARSAVFELVDRAREAGCRIVFDPNTRPELWDDDLALTLERMLLRTDLLKATREDFASTALLDAEAGFADQLLDMGPDTVLVTEGSKGARLVAGPDSPWGAGEWHHAGYDLDATDTTGAGDAFLAGTLAALAEGDGPTDPESALAFANAVAAVSTTAAGAMAALPDRATVDERYEEP
ncbi:carbohydrate kinase family protein [Halohasta salina]|uniref:carbohydrate kinase family protein n=1 Tax=Halohasta salina TaxID=2961621 RepID=UPI0020A46DC3|nr:carbohydrate kinase [Halohasta salina]